MTQDPAAMPWKDLLEHAPISNIPYSVGERLVGFRLPADSPHALSGYIFALEEMRRAALNRATPSEPSAGVREAAEKIANMIREHESYVLRAPAIERIARIIADSRPTIPAGWVLVPREPTEAMIEAADLAAREYTTYQFGADIPTIQQGPYDTYVAMLAAVPVDDSLPAMGEESPPIASKADVPPFMQMLNPPAPQTYATGFRAAVEAAAKVVDDWHKDAPETVASAGLRFHLAQAIRTLLPTPSAEPIGIRPMPMLSAWPRPWRYEADGYNDGPCIKDKNGQVMAALFWPIHHPDATKLVENQMFYLGLLWSSAVEQFQSLARHAEPPATTPSAGAQPVGEEWAAHEPLTDFAAINHAIRYYATLGHKSPAHAAVHALFEQQRRLSPEQKEG